VSETVLVKAASWVEEQWKERLHEREMEKRGEDE